MRSPSSPSDAVVIVGGGFGGLFTALALQRRQPNCPIVLIEPRDRFLFQPLLYELLSDELQGWEVAPRYDQLLNNGICWIQDSVVGIDQTSQSIELASGDRLSWSQLVLATGSKANDFGIPGVKEHSSSFRDLSDVSRLKQWLNNLHQQRDGEAGLIIVGAGPVRGSDEIKQLTYNFNAHLHVRTATYPLIPYEQPEERDGSRVKRPNLHPYHTVITTGLLYVVERLWGFPIKIKKSLY